MIQQALRCSARVLSICERGRPHARLAHPFISLTPVRGFATDFVPIRAGSSQKLRIRPLYRTLASAAMSAIMESQYQITYM